MTDLRALTRQFPRAGRLETIFVRPARLQAVHMLDRVLALQGRGLEGDCAAMRIPVSYTHLTLPTNREV